MQDQFYIKCDYINILGYEGNFMYFISGTYKVQTA